MKKSCFIISVLLFTIVVGAVVFIVKYKKESLKEYSKNQIINLAVSELDRKLSRLKDSVYRDSLSSELHKFFVRNDKVPFDNAIVVVEEVIKEAKRISNDGKIDSLDFNNFKKYISRYEKPEKNRN